MRRLINVVVLLVLLSAQAIAKDNFYTVTTSTFKDKESFSSIILPWNIINLYIDIDSKFIDKTFEIGDEVSKGDDLITVKPVTLIEDVISLIQTYFYRKSELNKEALIYDSLKKEFELGVVKKEDFNDSRIKYTKIKIELDELKRKILKKIKDKDLDINLESLTSENIDSTIQKVIKKLEKIVYRSPGSGIIIDNISQKIGNGPKVARVNDLSEDAFIPQNSSLVGIASNDEIKIIFYLPETKFGDIEIGQKVEITGMGFPGIVINGVVEKISQQGVRISESNLSQFEATVKAALPKQYQSKVKIGMSTKITIQFDAKNKISVPIGAIFLNANNDSMVTVLENGEKVDKKVITGSIKQDLIEVKDGLIKGDIIVVPN